jgi:NAD(P)H-hydrate epimerase
MSTLERIREVDRRAAEQYKIPSIILMENAARGLTIHAMRMLDWPNELGEDKITVLCGAGSNGGDALGAARHLHNAGLAMTVVLVSPEEKYQGDTRTNLEICRAMGLPVIDASDNPGATLDALPDADLVMDGLLGTGVKSEVREPVTDVIDWVNRRQDAPVLSVDLPSGMDCDTGKALGVCVAADVTVTFAGVKKGFLENGAKRYTGEVRLVSIGAPRDLIEELGERIPG